MRERVVLEKGWKLFSKNNPEKVYPIPEMPMQVHSVLEAAGVIGANYIWGDTQDCAWVPEEEWIYQVDFPYHGEKERTYLSVKGADTFADYYLNGVSIGSSDDFYLSYEFPISHVLKRENRLEIVFHPIKEAIERVSRQNPSPGKIQDSRLVRKNFHDFTNYLGGSPCLLKVGVFGDVLLEHRDEVELSDLQIIYTLDDSLSNAEVEVSAEMSSPCRTQVKVWAPDGSVCYFSEGSLASFSFALKDVKLWYPRGYGEQPLYKVQVSAYSVDGRQYDEITSSIGFRKIQQMGMLDFWINKFPIKLYGGNVTPIDGKTACIDLQRLLKIFHLAYECNMNSLRVWGEGERLPDYFYEEADRKGVLIWQEFFSGNAMYAAIPSLRELMKKEAQELVKRLRHHPCILLWCGGNECYLHRDFIDPKDEYLGTEIIENDYKKICSQLDGERYYHINSPFGGPYSNFPESGDTHSYTNTWFVPGGEYPVFVSENLRVSLPCPHSMRRYLAYIGEDPKTGVTSFMRSGEDSPWPEKWNRLTSADSIHKIPPVEEFYDADTLDSLCYRFGAAAGKYLRETVERYRRGKPVWDSKGVRRCKGHFVWKLNTSRPHIYSSVLDYYLEPYIPYYALKRAYSPILISFEISDRVYVWIINDSTQEVKGSLRVQLFDMEENKIDKEKSFPVMVAAGESELIGTLDCFGQFLRKMVIAAKLYSEDGELITDASTFADIERHLLFPQAALELSLYGDTLKIKSDTFARCVELSATDSGGETLGFYFSDNYFDLMPGEEKEVRIETNHRIGTIFAKAHYSQKISTVDYGRN